MISATKDVGDVKFSHTLLVVIQTDASSMKYSVKVLQKTKNKSTILSNYTTPWVYSVYVRDYLQQVYTCCQ